MPDTFSLRVNGVRHEVHCEPETPLLYVLRNDLGLTAAKFGCGLGLCGSCNVLVDGRPVRCADVPQGAARALSGLPGADGLVVREITGIPG